MQRPSRWLAHTAMTDPAGFAPQIRGLPGDVAALSRVIQGLLVHSDWLDAYGIDPSAVGPVSRTTLPVGERLAALTARDALPLADARPPAARGFATCRDFALLMCSFLRTHDIPARVRCGFAAYFHPGWEDHWVCERWDPSRSAWLLADPQIDAVVRGGKAIGFDAADVPRDSFLTAGRAWHLCRSGAVDPGAFGHGDTKGLWFVGVNVMRDSLSLDGRSASPWDRWREAAEAQRSVSDDLLPELDRVAGDPENPPGDGMPPWLSDPAPFPEPVRSVRP